MAIGRGHAWRTSRRQSRGGSDLSPGLADRVAALVADLADKPKLPIRRIRLIDPRAVHSVGWRRLLDRLVGCGVVVEQLWPAPAAPSDSAL